MTANTYPRLRHKISLYTYNFGLYTLIVCNNAIDRNINCESARYY